MKETEGNLIELWPGCAIDLLADTVSNINSETDFCPLPDDGRRMVGFSCLLHCQTKSEPPGLVLYISKFISTFTPYFSIKKLKVNFPMQIL